jgi:hypothetical protein
MEEKMKSKMIIMVTLMAFTLGCGAMEKIGTGVKGIGTGVKEKFSRKDKPVKEEMQEQEVVQPESTRMEAVTDSTYQEVKSTPEPVMPPIKIVSVMGSVVNVRSGPGTTNKVVTKVRRGDELEVRGETLSWYNVKLSNGVQGWIYKKLVR